MNKPLACRAALLRLSHALGDPRRQLAILGEGNTSARVTEETFLVKASGTNLETLREEDLVECRSATILELLNKTTISDSDVETALMESRVDPASKKPSVESLFHAWLLNLPGVGFVGHTHAVAVNSILCSPRAREFAEKRILPDEIVCCDIASVFVPYTDPGLFLALGVRDGVNGFVRKYRRVPRVVLLENHGIITLGRTVEAVLAAMFMAEKTAAIWLAAATLGGPKFLPPQEVGRIAQRPDEEVRQKVLNI